MTKHKKTKIKANKEMTQFIKHSNDNKTWRPNPADPFIYISFSHEQLVKTYGAMNDDGRGRSQLSSEAEELFKEIIVEEFAWLGVPIKFLDKNATPADMRQKNICFVDVMDLNGQQHQMKYRGLMMATKRVLAPCYENKKECVAATIMRTINFSADELSNPTTARQYRTALAHEFGHAIGCLKHARQYAQTDPGPYNTQLLCHETSMNYEDACPQIGARQNEIAQQLKEGKIAATQENMHKAFAEVDAFYPNGLGPLDHLAITEVFAEWDMKNKVEAKELHINYQSANMEYTDEHDELYQSNLQEVLSDAAYYDIYFGIKNNSSIVDSIIACAKHLSKQCQSYFNPTHINGGYWHSSASTFFQANKSYANQVEMLTSPLMSPLK